MTPQDVLIEVSCKWGEYIEMQPEESRAAFIIAALCNLVARERQNGEYYRKRIETIEADLRKANERINNGPGFNGMARIT